MEKEIDKNPLVLGVQNLLRALHMVEFIDEMIDNGKSSTLREMYYISELAW